MSSRSSSSSAASAHSLVPWKTPPAPDTTGRFRLVYLPTDEGEPTVQGYHHHLVNAEVLLARAMAAQEVGIRPIHPLMSRLDEQRYRARPVRDQYPEGSANRLRWFNTAGQRRERPLSREDLAIELMTANGWSLDKAVQQCWESLAMSAADQAWLEVRGCLPIHMRPLNGREYHQLIEALEAVHSPPVKWAVPLQRNIERAFHAVKTLGTLFDEYVSQPFHHPVLAATFNESLTCHLENLLERAQLRLKLVQGPIFCPSLQTQAHLAKKHAERSVRFARLKQGQPESDSPTELM